MTELEQHALNIRKNILRQVYWAQSGHPRGSLSAADILTYLGLGSVVAEVLAITKIGYPVLMIGLHDEFDQK